MTFHPETLIDTLAGWPQPSGYWVAYSGGLDSTALLHALVRVRARLPASLHALHVHHGWHAAADTWEAACATTCARLEVPYRSLRLAAAPRHGESREAAARAARYAAFAELLPDHAMLLTAHHRDDQAETVLLQLLRGAGPAGLAGIAALKPLGGGWVGRPLLGTSRDALRVFAERQHLSWIDDPSNADTGFDRNYLRAAIMPRLRARWPGLSTALARSARHCATAAEVCDERGRLLFEACPDNAPFRLAASTLVDLSPQDQGLLLRHWLRVSGLPLPDANRLARLVSEVAEAGEARAPRVAWPGVEVRRYRERLYAMPPLDAPPGDRVAIWAGGDALALPSALGCLRLGQGGVGLPVAAWRQGPVEVRFGGEGLAARPTGRVGTRSFKRLCQEWGIPPWVRPRLPLLFLAGRLAAVGDYGTCEPFAVGPGEPAVRLSWDRPAFLA